MPQVIKRAQVFFRKPCPSLAVGGRP
jgi:hypothetical protein